MLIDRLVSTADAHPHCDYISYASSDGQPSIVSPLGPFAEWCSAKAIAAADRLATDPRDRQEVTRYVFSHPKQFKLNLVQLPLNLERKDVQLRHRRQGRLGSHPGDLRNTGTRRLGP